MKPSLTLPTRSVRDYLSCSDVWSAFLADGGFMVGDIVIADPFKAGTTWTQWILQQILHNGAELEASLSDSSPWLDSSFGDHPAMLASLRQQRQRGERRVIKSHLPADCLPIDAEARYVFVGRNGKDLAISFHRYLRQFSPETMARIDAIHATWSAEARPLLIPEDPQEFFEAWLSSDGYGCCDLFDVVQSWWQQRHKANVLLLHYAQLNQDPEGQIRRLATFIGVDPEVLKLDRILEHASFSFMRAHAEQLAPFGGKHMQDARMFFDKGPTRDHRNVINSEQIELFDQRARRKLSPACAHWLETGQGQG